MMYDYEEFAEVTSENIYSSTIYNNETKIWNE